MVTVSQIGQIDCQVDDKLTLIESYKAEHTDRAEMDPATLARRTSNNGQPRAVTDTNAPVRRPGRPRMKDSLPADPNDNSVGRYLRAKPTSLALLYKS